MSMKLRLRNGRSAVFISAYAPTMAATDDEKEAFYESLNIAISFVPYKHRLFVLGDFNSRVAGTTLCGPEFWAITLLAMRIQMAHSCCRPVHKMNLSLPTACSNKPTNTRRHGCIPDLSIGTCWNMSSLCSVMFIEHVL
jgi:hypothetical protein